MKLTQTDNSAYSNSELARIIRFLSSTQKHCAVKEFSSVINFIYILIFAEKSLSTLNKKKKKHLPFHFSAKQFLAIITVTSNFSLNRKILRKFHAAWKNIIPSVVQHQSLQVYAHAKAQNILWERRAWGQRLLLLWIHTRTWSPRKAQTLTLTRPGTNSPK